MAKSIVIYSILMAFMGPWGDYVFASCAAFGHKAGCNVVLELASGNNLHFCFDSKVIHLFDLRTEESLLF